MNPRTVTKAFKRLVDGAGVQKVSFHALRHTHITHLLAGGIHPKVALERAGHASVSVTLDTFSHVTENMQREAASLTDQIMAKAQKC